MAINYLLPILSAIIGIATSPGNGAGFLAIILFVPLLLAIRDGRKIYFKTLLFGIPYYFYNLIWINSSVSHYGNAPMIVGLLCVLGISLYMSIYLLIYMKIQKYIKSSFALALTFMLLEMLRGVLFTGFPWLNLGGFLYDYKFATTIYKNIGEYGATFLVMLVNINIYRIITDKKYVYGLHIILMIIIVLVIAGFDESSSNSKKVRISVIQPKYSQEEKWLPDKKEDIKAEVLNIVGEALSKDNDIIVLSESVFPFFIQNDNATFNYFLSNSKHKSIILGNVRYDENYRYYNSAFFFENGKYDYYDKIKLVPFGEYFPLKFLTRPISRYFFGDADDFKQGSESKVFQTDKGVKILPVICYESAFYKLFRDGIKKKNPDIIAVLSNDSWFGGKIGRMQHLSIDIVRAKEFSKPVIRATQSGISACISKEGDILESMQINESGIMNCSLETSGEITIFARYGYIWIYVCLGAVIFIQIFNKAIYKPNRI